MRIVLDRLIFAEDIRCFMILIYFLIGLVAGAGLGYFVRQQIGAKRVGTAEGRAEKIIEEAHRKEKEMHEEMSEHMPKGTKVHKCVEKVKAKNGKVNPYAVCQASTKQSYKTGKPLKKGKS